MTFFVWEPGLSVGNEAIDDDHRKMIALINLLHAAMEKGVGEPLVRGMLDELDDYVVGHFGREEEYMHRLLYVGYTEHKKAHRAFRQQVQSLRSAFREGAYSMAVPTLLALRGWLSSHILNADRALADTIRKSKET